LLSNPNIYKYTHAKIRHSSCCRVDFQVGLPANDPQLSNHLFHEEYHCAHMSLTYFPFYCIGKIYEIDFLSIKSEIVNVDIVKGISSCDFFGTKYDGAETFLFFIDD
jgi:hypothetical protein